MVSSFCLNKDTVGVSTTSDGKQFHLSMPLCEKNWPLTEVEQVSYKVLIDDLLFGAQD